MIPNGRMKKTQIEDRKKKSNGRKKKNPKWKTERELKWTKVEEPQIEERRRIPNGRK